MGKGRFEARVSSACRTRGRLPFANLQQELFVILIPLFFVSAGLVKAAAAGLADGGRKRRSQVG